VILERITLAGLVWAATVAGSAWWAYGAGRDHELATQHREARAAQIATAAAADAAASAIQSIKVRHVTIRQSLEREVREVPVYTSPDCRLSAAGLRDLNAALSGDAASAPAGRGLVPTPDALGR
jgi:hypothetical protein